MGVPFSVGGQDGSGRNSEDLSVVNRGQSVFHFFSEKRSWSILITSGIVQKVVAEMVAEAYSPADFTASKKSPPTGKPHGD